MTDKPVIWLGRSRESVTRFPADARRIAGFQLRRLQFGLEPNDSKPMRSIGLGVSEIRIHTEHEHRVVYVARYEEAIYVVHAFEKRSRKTARLDVELIRARLKRLVISRRSS